MVQEIITYLIIGGAIFAAAILLLRKPVRKKQTGTAGPGSHNCNSCPADCMLRNSPGAKKEKEPACRELSQASE